MVSTVGGLNPRPLSHESSALTTRPRLLAYIEKLSLNLNLNVVKIEKKDLFILANS